MKAFFEKWFKATVTAVVYCLAVRQTADVRTRNRATHFVACEIVGMPDFLRLPAFTLVLVFDLAGILHAGRLFHRQTFDQRSLQIEAWRCSVLSPCRDLVRLFENLSMLGLRGWSGLEGTAPAIISLRKNRSKVAVIGSGPGGSITACLLAEAGLDVTLIEEGSHFPLSFTEPFSVDEIRLKYRHGGLTPAFGESRITYAEGRCVGGGSEINSGLYHRLPAEILDLWQQQYGVRALEESVLRPIYEQNERDVSVSLLQGTAPAASLKLDAGAKALGWKSMEVPRWFRQETGTQGVRQSMTQTFIPRALEAGCQLRPDTRAVQLARQGNDWVISTLNRYSREQNVFHAESVFLCGGATQSPSLLLRSGISRNVGNNLQLHPTVKVVAHFSDQVNSRDMGVPVHQVKEFAPRFSLGCSISSPPFLGVGLLDYPEYQHYVDDDWQRLAIYYAMIVPEGRGSVRTLPGFRDPLVRFALTERDLSNLGEGLRKLCDCLFEAGASELFPGISPSLSILRKDDLFSMPQRLSPRQTSIMTIHLFSSCPMGEDLAKCAVDSFGKVHGVPSLHISDASLLCSAPGVNPQGTIMALARRNALHFLNQL